MRTIRSRHTDRDLIERAPALRRRSVRVRSSRGFSLYVVMVAISMSLVLTYSFMRSQTTALQIGQNGLRRNLALQAAQTGAAVALERMQSPSWEGVENHLTGVLESDRQGTTSYKVRFLPLAATGRQPLPPDVAFRLVVWSTGVWQSAENTNERVERHVEVVVRLKPRVSGLAYEGYQSGNPGNDVASNPDDYDLIQSFALFAGEGPQSLVLDPGARIDGSLWLQRQLALYGDPHWNPHVRDQVLDDLGMMYVTGTDPLIVGYPHPISGSITFEKSPPGSLKNDLGRLGIPWSEMRDAPRMPSIDFRDWGSYRLYEGGFEYEPVSVGSRLRNQTLRPSPENPLGIFYRNGSLWIDDNVTVQGTLIVTGEVNFCGNSVSVSAFNWRGEGGTPIASRSQHWPRFPAIVANAVWFDRNGVRTLVDGAIVVNRGVRGAGGTFEHFARYNIDLVGTATSWPAQQPFSVVQLDDSVDLSVLPSNFGREYAIWLDDASSGAWYTIADADVRQHQLTVVGEVANETPTSYRIRPNRERYVDIHGPVCGAKHDINRRPEWDLTESLWSERLAAWQATVEALESQAQEESAGEQGNGNNKTKKNDNANENSQHGDSEYNDPTGVETPTFVEWLADPQNYAEWPQYYRTYGLTLEPTFHLRNTRDIKHSWSPPLFRPCDATVYGEEPAGYRWEVISWREAHDVPELADSDLGQ